MLARRCKRLSVPALARAATAAANRTALRALRAANGGLGQQQQQKEQPHSQSAITAYDEMLQDKERVIRE